MAKRDYYEVLGVSSSSSEEEIRNAFRKKAMEYNPDRNKDAGAPENDDGGRLGRMLAAQTLWDAAMADSIANTWRKPVEVRIRGASRTVGI